MFLLFTSDNVNAVEEIGEWLSRMHAVVLGPGLGRNENLLPTIKVCYYMYYDLSVMPSPFVGTVI